MPWVRFRRCWSRWIRIRTKRILSHGWNTDKTRKTNPCLAFGVHTPGGHEETRTKHGISFRVLSVFLSWLRFCLGLFPCHPLFRFFESQPHGVGFGGSLRFDAVLPSGLTGGQQAGDVAAALGILGDLEAGRSEAVEAAVRGRPVKVGHGLGPAGGDTESLGRRQANDGRSGRRSRFFRRLGANDRSGRRCRLRLRYRHPGRRGWWLHHAAGRVDRLRRRKVIRLSGHRRTADEGGRAPRRPSAGSRWSSCHSDGNQRAQSENQ